MPRKLRKKRKNQSSFHENVEESPPNQDFRTSPNQETLPSIRPARAARVRCIENLSRISKERFHYLNVLQKRTWLRVASENDEQRQRRLEYLRRRSSQRMATESVEQRKRRLEDQRRRWSHRIANESVEQRERRLKRLRLRASLRIANESDEQRKRRLEDLRRRHSLRIATESVEQRGRRLEDQRLRSSRRLLNESVEHRERRLEDLRRRAAERKSTERKEQRERRLEDLRRRAADRKPTERKEQCEQRLEDLWRRAAERKATERNEQRELCLEYQQQQQEHQLEEKRHHLDTDFTFNQLKNTVKTYSRTVKRQLIKDAVPKMNTKIKKSDAEEESNQYMEVLCNNCLKVIVGFRFKCITCEDYNLCKKCEMMEIHSDHVLRIPKPFKHEDATENEQKMQQIFNPDTNTTPIKEEYLISECTAAPKIAFANANSDFDMQYSSTEVKQEISEESEALIDIEICETVNPYLTENKYQKLEHSAP